MQRPIVRAARMIVLLTIIVGMLAGAGGGAAALGAPAPAGHASRDGRAVAELATRAAATAATPNQQAKLAQSLRLPTADGGAVVHVDKAQVSVSRLTAGTVVVQTGADRLALTVPTTRGGQVSTVGMLDVSVGTGAVDAVVERRADGLRAMTVIHGATAPSRYDYALAGGRFRALPSGVVLVENQRGQIVGGVDAPWAIDATGRALPTRYEVTDGRLTQHVDHHGAVYPVVADPSVSFGWWVYVRYSRSEVASISVRAAQVGNLLAMAMACAMITVPWLAAACGVIGTTYIDSVIGTIRDAQAAGQCVEMRYTYNGLLLGWRRYNC